MYIVVLGWHCVHGWQCVTIRNGFGVHTAVLSCLCVHRWQCVRPRNGFSIYSCPQLTLCPCLAVCHTGMVSVYTVVLSWHCPWFAVCHTKEWFQVTAVPSWYCVHSWQCVTLKNGFSLNICPHLTLSMVGSVSHLEMVLVYIQLSSFDTVSTVGSLSH